jgi:alkanesulfonate monooxygenase SsuD/methylene tetrahydromethanopterin reductase-like flavin-dependent oxidoreductase (luciferase family)
MPDYGQPLRFGISISPGAADFGSMLDLARQADDVGLDYLAVQDHPYQPAHLDMWTLLTYLVAHTERISVVPDVADLQLRPAPMLANAAASLAAMAGGRVQLGVGAGSVPILVTSMGGMGRSGGDAVAYTEEAVGILRRALRGETVKADTVNHRIAGYKAGPTPPEPIEVWVGAVKPRMLALVGRAAQGWMCPLNIYVPPEEAARSHGLIDVAARGAGRDPGEVRRIYNVAGAIESSRRSRGLVGTVKAWIDVLCRWALGLGFDTFIFWPQDDHAEQVKLFANEIAPAVRDRVARLRDQPVTRVL